MNPDSDKAIFVDEQYVNPRGHFGSIFEEDGQSWCQAYADHLALYRQSEIFDREELYLDRSTLADWVGKTTALLEP